MAIHQNSFLDMAKSKKSWQFLTKLSCRNVKHFSLLNLNIFLLYTLFFSTRYRMRIVFCIRDLYSHLLRNCDNLISIQKSFLAKLIFVLNQYFLTVTTVSILWISYMNLTKIRGANWNSSINHYLIMTRIMRLVIRNSPLQKTLKAISQTPLFSPIWCIINQLLIE